MHKQTSLQILLSGIVFLRCSPARVQAAIPESPVTVSEEADSVTLANGIVSTKINKANANLLSLRYRDVELLSRGGGYWNIYGATLGQPSTELKGTPSVFSIS